MATIEVRHQDGSPRPRGAYMRHTLCSRSRRRPPGPRGPAGGAAAPSSARRPQGWEWYQGAPARGPPETEQPRRPAVGRGRSSQPSWSLRTDVRWPRTCPARGDERAPRTTVRAVVPGALPRPVDQALPTLTSRPGRSARRHPRTTLGPHANEKRRQTLRSTTRQNRRSAAVFRQAERGADPRLLDVVVQLELAPHS